MNNVVVPALVDHASNRLASLVRLRNGSIVAKRSGSPPTPDLVLWEYEASPYCRHVRETLCILGLRVRIKPCPRETLRREGAFSAAAKHKPEVAKRGRILFPFLHDRSADVALNESSAIVAHLWRTYGESVVERPRSDTLLDPSTLPRPLFFALLAAPSGVRPWPSAGLMMAQPVPATPQVAHLVLHGNEANGARPVANPRAPCAPAHPTRLTVPTAASSCAAHRGHTLGAGASLRAAGRVRARACERHGQPGAPAPRGPEPRLPLRGRRARGARALGRALSRGGRPRSLLRRASAGAEPRR